MIKLTKAPSFIG